MNKKEIDNDALGRAYLSYLQGNKNAEFILHSSDFDPDTIAISHFFRTFDDMPELEQIAILECKGAILDVGAGSGTHSLELQKKGFKITAIDISPRAVDVMKQRGVAEAQLQDFFTISEGKYDTILFLMNGIGLIQTTDNFPKFFRKIDDVLAEGGQVLLDSSDLRYLYENEDGSFDIPLNDSYYGQVDFKVEFENYISEPFNWVYIDFDTLRYYAQKSGYVCECIAVGEHYDYLARLVKRL